MPEFFIPLVPPITNLSIDHTFGENYPQPPLGNLIGDGDLSTVGDGAGVELWDPTNNHTQQAGQDIYQYALGSDSLPSGAVVTAARVELVATFQIDLSIVTASAAANGGTVTTVDVDDWLIDYGRAGLGEFDTTRVTAATSSVGVKVYVDGVAKTTVDVPNVGTAATVSKPLALDLLTPAEWTDGTHTVTLQGFQNDLGTLAHIAAAVVDGAWIVLTYDLSTVPQIPQCRIWPRDEGRVWPPNRRDRTGGRVGGYQ